MTISTKIFRPGVTGVAVVLALLAALVRPPDADAAPPRMWGVSLPGVPTDLSGLDQLDGELGAQPGVVMWYSAWSDKTAFPTQAAATLAGRGAIPEITWEPWNPANGVDQPTYANARIARGAFDTYIASWAKAIKAYGQPVRLRYAHEMNGNWYPWADGVNGNAAGSYVKAWNHVRAVFAKHGVTNVTWIWSPNVPYPGSVPLSQVFPGDNNADEIALDGYNWGTTQTWSSWQSFADVFGQGIAQLEALSSKPISIGEVGCTDAGGDKPTWIADMWTTLASWPQVRGLMWFDYDKETDWRIDSSPQSATAFSAGITDYLAG